MEKTEIEKTLEEALKELRLLRQEVDYVRSRVHFYDESIRKIRKRTEIFRTWTV